MCNDFDLSCKLLERARGAVSGPEAFRIRLELDIRLLSCLLDDLKNPAIKAQLHRFRDLYLAKVPELRELLVEQLTEVGAAELISELEGGLLAGGGGGGQLWVPGSSGESGGTGGQLWLPGQ